MSNLAHFEHATRLIFILNNSANATGRSSGVVTSALCGLKLSSHLIPLAWTHGGAGLKEEQKDKREGRRGQRRFQRCICGFKCFCFFNCISMCCLAVKTECFWPDAGFAALWLPCVRCSRPDYWSVPPANVCSRWSSNFNVMLSSWMNNNASHNVFWNSTFWAGTALV